MRWEITGTDLRTKEPVVFAVKACDALEAAERGKRRGVAVTGVRPAGDETKNVDRVVNAFLGAVRSEPPKVEADASVV